MQDGFTARCGAHNVDRKNVAGSACRTPHAAFVVALLALSLVLGARPSHGAAACVGDCDGSGDVTVNELITMVNIALGSAPLSNCMDGDADGSGDITINEIIAAVNNALGACPPPAATPTPTAPRNSPTPTLGPLGTRHFVLNPAHSTFTAVLSSGAVLLGSFQGQKNGETGLLGYLDLQAGQPDNQGFATINVVDASDYLYVDATAQAQAVFCIKPIVPVVNAGLVACNGGPDFSIALTQNHHLGQVGIDGFTAARCSSESGSAESPNQICGAGLIGSLCRTNSDCDSGAGDGVCGLSPSTCSMPSPTQGTACQADADCDTTAGSNDGVCGQPGPHPGVCNGTFEASQLGGDSGPGAVSIAPVPQLGLHGLPAEISTELALPCGDEGSGEPAPFALTSAAFESTILNFNNVTTICGAGTVDNRCTINADCDSAAGAGDGVCGAVFQYATQGENFSCANWTASDAPGCLVFSAPQLDSNPQTDPGDLITAFTFCAR